MITARLAVSVWLSRERVGQWAISTDVGGTIDTVVVPGSDVLPKADPV
jgi:hypothetical protein